MNAHARAVDQDVDSSPLRHGAVHHRVDLRAVADVRADEADVVPFRCQVPRARRAALIIDVGDDRTRPLQDEPLQDDAADPLRRPRYDDDLSPKLARHVTPPDAAAAQEGRYAPLGKTSLGSSRGRWTANFVSDPKCLWGIAAEGKSLKGAKIAVSQRQEDADSIFIEARGMISDLD